MSHRAFIIGEFQTADLNVERFQATVEQLNYVLEKHADYGPAIRRLNARSAERSEEHDLVLFCIGPELQRIREYLRAIRAENRRIVVYAHERRASPQAAIEYCHDGFADDYFVWGDHVSANRIEQHVKALHQGRSPYPKIEVLRRHRDKGKARAFIATPYDPVNRTLMTDAVDHVMGKVNLIPCWADDTYRDASVPEQVLNEIRRSAL